MTSTFSINCKYTPKYEVLKGNDIILPPVYNRGKAPTFLFPSCFNSFDGVFIALTSSVWPEVRTWDTRKMVRSYTDTLQIYDAELCVLLPFNDTNKLTEIGMSVHYVSSRWRKCVYYEYDYELRWHSSGNFENPCGIKELKTRSTVSISFYQFSCL